MGPGTPLELNLVKGVKPENKLGEVAMYHDIAYSKNNKLGDRHRADKQLDNKAWKRVLANDSTLGEKLNVLTWSPT